ncbi:hypothetical protein HY485_03175 [Candidatus Woesearchaeota archaeon]|nr:hypothetical protein [Candidatus Woesearchaeota archaeon]
MSQSLLCFEDSGHIIAGKCRMIYRLNEDSALSGIVDECIPHAPICVQHLLDRVPLEDFRETAYDIKGVVYGVSRLLGFEMLTREGMLASQYVISRYLSHNAMQKFLPKTLMQINSDEAEGLFGSLKEKKNE